MGWLKGWVLLVEEEERARGQGGRRKEGGRGKWDMFSGKRLGCSIPLGGSMDGIREIKRLNE